MQALHTPVKSRPVQTISPPGVSAYTRCGVISTSAGLKERVSSPPDKSARVSWKTELSSYSKALAMGKVPAPTGYT